MRTRGQYLLWTTELLRTHAYTRHIPAPATTCTTHTANGNIAKAVPDGSYNPDIHSMKYNPHGNTHARDARFNCAQYYGRVVMNDALYGYHYRDSAVGDTCAQQAQGGRRIAGSGASDGIATAPVGA